MIQAFTRYTCDDRECGKSVDVPTGSGRSEAEAFIEIQFNSKFAGHLPGKVFTFCGGTCLVHALYNPSDLLPVRKP